MKEAILQQLPVVVFRLVQYAQMQMLPLCIGMGVIGVGTFVAGDIVQQRRLKILTQPEFTKEQKAEAKDSTLYLVLHITGIVMAFLSCVLLGIGGYYDPFLATLGF